MKQNTFSGQYLAPEVKVVETKPQGVLCASGNKEKYDNGSWSW